MMPTVRSNLTGPLLAVIYAFALVALVSGEARAQSIVSCNVSDIWSENSDICDTTNDRVIQCVNTCRTRVGQLNCNFISTEWTCDDPNPPVCDTLLGGCKAYKDCDGDSYADDAELRNYWNSGCTDSIDTTDCDDDPATGASFHPGIVESLSANNCDDNLDNNCDGSTDENWVNVDGDFAQDDLCKPGAPIGTGEDCNDNNTNVYPWTPDSKA